jgi:sugar O-acyltransferase (sialic acid O-acetyltransferase NeuD family)
MSVVIYGIGSPIVVDVAETCARLGLEVAAWVRNVEGPTFAPPGSRVLTPDRLTAELRSNEFVVPLFTPGHRAAAAREALGHGFVRAATLVDATAVVAASTTLEAGCYVNSMANLGAAGAIGRFALINRGASIGHHAEIAEFVSIGPGAVIAGNVKIGRGAMVGTGAIVIPKIEIGANAVVSAGAVVIEPVAAHSMVAGNPARVVRTGIGGYNDTSV